MSVHTRFLVDVKCCYIRFKHFRNPSHTFWTQIIGTLVSLMMGVPHIDWSRPCQHVETFAGCQSVTIGEMQARAYYVL